MRTSSLFAGQLAMGYVRYIGPGEVSGSRGKLGGMGAMPTDLAHLLELSILRNMETAPRFEEAQLCFA